ncbi:tripartite tricarboxylate transporter TctB family protein [Paracoccus saliphilus]|uniref:Tricarboxylic transport membrane protein n=1 Tax=Paracoccus saliphilus TaxID=405559 RepID=A0AA45W2L5_9RHOB|nr:tripartite tricarboxylate transporter TctB family protein [Paracoccus saliphilus]WCR01461.1 tripartite tricarboxylate transporter TctB family protein [Paracoccus saliphilus]SIS69173.1 putative tricarboxylic transport membrane protein [Paracoccus saliphilus]
MNTIKNTSDLTTGLVFTVLGLTFTILSDWSAFGTAVRMGPSFFPIILGCLLVVIGVACLLRSLKVEDVGLTPIARKAILLIPLSVVFFGLVVRGLGFVPAVAGVTILSFTASSRFRLGTALIAATVLVVFTSAVFIYGLKLPLPLFGEWLGN